MNETPESGHTPLRVGMPSGHNASNIYCGDDAICSVYGIALHRSLDELSERDVEGLAWANRIVRACNSHYQLVDALREWDAILSDGLLNVDPERIERAREMQRTALTQAIGGV